METAKDVVMSLEFVHKTATVFGWRFNLSRKRRRSVAAGVLALSNVTVVFMTRLLWSEISKSFHPNFREVQNKALQQAVWGLGRKKEADAFPMAEIKLHGYSSRVGSFYSGL